jgi:phospholipid/cholesterol/gamma-HCH transport system substrate-binding protein
VALLLVCAALLAGVYGQFRGAFTTTTPLTVLADRAGLVMDPGAKVTYNGVAIGRVGAITEQQVDGMPKARMRLDIDPAYVDLIPANVHVTISATTVFGNKYVSFTSPEDPTAQRISSSELIDVAGTSTEFNTLFETITSISEKVDPVRLNATLSAAAEALTGLGAEFGRSLANGNQILGDLNPRLPVLRHDVRALADLTQVYTRASPQLWDGLDAAVTTARALHDQQGALDAALLAAIGFGNTAADVFARGGPYLVRGSADLIPTTQTLDENSPAIYCTTRNFAAIGPRVAASLGGNGYSLASASASGGGVTGAANPYIYPDNLPRLNAKGGPGGKPGCWQSITRDLWPAPYLVVDRGQHCAIQPFRAGPTAPRRVRLGPPGRCVHDQSVTDITPGPARPRNAAAPPAPRRRRLH